MLTRALSLLLPIAATLLTSFAANADELLRGNAGDHGSGIRFSSHAAELRPPGLSSSLTREQEANGEDEYPGQEREEEGGEETLSASEYLVQHALGYLGVRYRFGGTSPKTGLDCSGLVLNVFRNALDVELPRTAGEMSRLGEKIARHDLKPGDLVFFNTMRRAFSHVGIYLGEGEFVHAPSTGGKVKIEKLASSYWAKRFNGARRLIGEQDEHPALGQNLGQNLTLLR
ncbi:MAG: C40 family peptidase [Thauera sp.]|jgi:cell wall-associated NlpC family hydrolase|nr:C40 family peptidase [Thauera sp.]